MSLIKFSRVITRKLKKVHVDHLKRVEGDGIENQLINVDSSLTKLFESESEESNDTEREAIYTVFETNIEAFGVNDHQASNKYSSRGRLIRPKLPFSP